MLSPIKFTIYGNHENEAGNPIPYTRTTQKGKWGAKYQRYVMWKSHVQDAFLKAFPGKENTDMRRVWNKNFLNFNKPIALRKDEKVKMSIMITFVGERRGDPDNIFKGIADALFANDKNVAGNIDFQSGEKGKVEVEIVSETV